MHFGQDPKPSSGMVVDEVPLHTALHNSQVCRKIPLTVLIKTWKKPPGEKKKKKKSGNHQKKKLRVPCGFDEKYLGDSHAKGMPAISGLCLCLSCWMRVAALRFVFRESVSRVWRDCSNLIRKGLARGAAAAMQGCKLLSRGLPRAGEHSPAGL